MKITSGTTVGQVAVRQPVAEPDSPQAPEIQPSGNPAPTGDVLEIGGNTGSSAAGMQDEGIMQYQKAAKGVMARNSVISSAQQPENQPQGVQGQAGAPTNAQAAQENHPQNPQQIQQNLNKMAQAPDAALLSTLSMYV